MPWQARRAAPDASSEITPLPASSRPRTPSGSHTDRASPRAGPLPRSSQERVPAPPPEARCCTPTRARVREAVRGFEIPGSSVCVWSSASHPSACVFRARRRMTRCGCMGGDAVTARTQARRALCLSWPSVVRHDRNALCGFAADRLSCARASGTCSEGGARQPGVFLVSYSVDSN